MGAIIWSCLALTVHQAPVQEYYMPGRGFKIPITLNPKRAAEIQELILLVSQDKGVTWQQAQHKPPSEREFIFHAPADGSYWFIVQQLDNNGRTIPSDPARVKPNMAVIVDTVKPRIEVKAERLANGWIKAHWKTVEAAPEPRSVRLDYQTAALSAGRWAPLPADSVLEGSKEFDPGRDGQSGEVRVRVRMKDQAGNEGEEMFVLPPIGPPAIAAPAAGGPGGAAERSPFNLIPASQADPSGQATQLTSQQRPQAPLDPQPQGTGGAAPAIGNMPVASSPDRIPPPSANPVPPPANSPAVKYVKSREVRLDFTVAKVGPSGLGAADVYVTLDRGATWTKMPGDVPISLPPNADLHEPEPVPGSVSVQLRAEGTLYGFLVAVKSKAGLAPPPPRPGDPPQALVELDTTVPKAQMFRPQPDTSQPNTLILGWTAVDRNLPDRPVKLEWAEQKDGPWQPIGEDTLPNSGQYPWRLPEHLPPRVYLRLTVRDLAGNEARAQTDKPELIDLSVPQTTIIGVAPNAR